MRSCETGNAGNKSCLVCIYYVALQSNGKPQSVIKAQNNIGKQCCYLQEVYTKTIFLGVTNYVCNALVCWRELSVEWRGLLCIFNFGTL